MSIRLCESEVFLGPKSINTQLIKYQDTKYHSHEFIEFFYVVNGEAIHNLNGKKSRIKQGQAFLLLPDDNHSFEYGDKDFMHRDLLIKNDFFKKICNQYSPTLYKEILEKKYLLNFIPDKSNLASLEKLSENLEINLKQSSELLEKQICYDIIGSIIFSSTNNINQNNEKIARLVKVLSSPQFFKYDLSEILNMENVGYCHEYICRLFKKKTGTTMTSFFNTNKIEYAITLKKTGFYTNSDIREIINISNESYFYKLLKKNNIKLK